VVGFLEQFEVHPGPIGPAPGRSLNRSLVLSGDQMVVRFRQQSTDRRFTLILSKLATVNDAKREVAAFLEAPSGDWITMLVDGKPLRGSMRLSRFLSNEIAVCVKDGDAVRSINCH
jgi:hypothetical protein